MLQLRCFPTPLSLLAIVVWSWRPAVAISAAIAAAITAIVTAVLAVTAAAVTTTAVTTTAAAIATTAVAISTAALAFTASIATITTVWLFRLSILDSSPAILASKRHPRPNVVA